MNALVAYDEACRALALATTVDQAKDIADKAEAMRAYARVAKNRQLEIDAAEIRIRAERRLGALIGEAKAAGQLSEGRPRTTNAPDENPHSRGGFSRVTLAEAGIDHNLSSRAQKLAKLPDGDFALQLKAWRAAAEGEAARVSVRLLKGEAARDKKMARAVREEILGRKILQLPEKRYGVIYADPEWRFEPYSRESGLDRSADNHYPTSALEEILARPVQSIAAKDCVLFLWATAPMLPQALQVMAAWGFEYRSQVIWKKVFPGGQKGTGYWFRNEHELLLVGVRGDVPAPAPGLQWSSVVNAPVGKHSEKPGQFHDLIEAYFPTLPKIELNARRARPGWDVWGNEAPEGGAAPRDAENINPAGEIPPLDRPAGETGDGDVPSLAVPGEDLEIPAFLDRRPKVAA